MSFKKIGPLILVILFGSFITYQVVINKQELKNLQLSFSALNLFLLMTSLLLVYLVNVLSWHILISLIGARLSFGVNSKIWLISNLSRLVPGGILQYPSRVILLSQTGISKVIATKAVVFEILFTLMGGCLISLISIDRWNLPSIFSPYRIYLYLFTLCIFFLILALSLGFAEKIINWGAKLRGKEINIVHLGFSPFLIIPMILVFSLRFIITGAVLFFLLQGFVTTANISAWEMIGKFSLSWIVGYLAFFSPGGLGVMEATLTGLLSANFGVALAGIIAIFFRILLLISEFIFVLVFTYKTPKKN